MASGINIEDRFEAIGFTGEEIQLAKVILAAREVQTFLWGEVDGEAGIEEWRRMFRKRVAKIDEIDVGKLHAAVEMRKRLLQMAAISVGLLNILEKQGIPVAKPGYVSDLQEYSRPIKEYGEGTFLAFIEKTVPVKLGKIADNVWQVGKRNRAMDRDESQRLKRASGAIHEVMADLREQLRAFKKGLGIS